IETTGLADPAPVIQALMTMPVARRFRLQQVVTAVDAVHGLSTLDAHMESVKQAAVADDIVVPKLDAGAPDIEPLNERLRRLSPPPRPRTQPATPARALFAAAWGPVDIYDPGRRGDGGRLWPNAEPYGQPDAHDAQGDNHHHHHDVNRHSADIGSFCLQFDE